MKEKGFLCKRGTVILENLREVINIKHNYKEFKLRRLLLTKVRQYNVWQVSNKIS